MARSRLTKRDLVERVSSRGSGATVPKGTVQGIVHETISQIVSSLANGEDVCFKELGSFRVVARKGRDARNPATNEIVVVPARNGIRFKASKAMTEAINRKA